MHYLIYLFSDAKRLKGNEGSSPDQNAPDPDLSAPSGPNAGSSSADLSAPSGPNAGSSSADLSAPSCPNTDCKKNAISNKDVSPK